MQRKIKWGFPSPSSEDEGGENKTRGVLSPPPPPSLLPAPRSRKTHARKTDIHKLKLQDEFIHLIIGGEIIYFSMCVCVWEGASSLTVTRQRLFLKFLQNRTINSLRLNPLARQLARSNVEVATLIVLYSPSLLLLLVALSSRVTFDRSRCSFAWTTNTISGNDATNWKLPGLLAATKRETTVKLHWLRSCCPFLRGHRDTLLMPEGNSLADSHI